MGILPLLHQYCDSHPCVDHHEALCGLTVTFGLVTTYDLLWCNTDCEIFLALLLGSGQLRSWIHGLKLARLQVHLFDDESIWHLKQDVQWVSC